MYNLTDYDRGSRDYDTNKKKLGNRVTRSLTIKDY